MNADGARLTVVAATDTGGLLDRIWPFIVERGCPCRHRPGGGSLPCSCGAIQRPGIYTRRGRRDARLFGAERAVEQVEERGEVTLARLLVIRRVSAIV